MESVEARIERLKAALKRQKQETESKVKRLVTALKILETVGGGHHLLLTQKTGSTYCGFEDWRTVVRIETTKEYACYRIAYMLMVTVGLDPDGEDGVKLAPD